MYEILKTDKDFNIYTCVNSERKMIYFGCVRKELIKKDGGKAYYNLRNSIGRALRAKGLKWRANEWTIYNTSSNKGYDTYKCIKQYKQNYKDYTLLNTQREIKDEWER